MSQIFLVAYEGACPRCGDDLGAADDALARWCTRCGIGVQAAVWSVDDSRENPS